MKRGKKCLKKYWNKSSNSPKVAASEDMVIIVEAAAVAINGINDLQWMEVTTTSGKAEAVANLPPYG